MNGNGASVSNATFAGNNATTGAGIVSNGNGTNVTGSTFANNTAETGAGMVVNGANSTIGNSSFTGNNATDSGSAISVGGNATNTTVGDDNKVANNTAKGQDDTNIVTYYATVTVDPIVDTPINEAVTITVNVKGEKIGLDGRVFITVNGVNYNSTLTDGKAVFTIPGNLAVGSYNVTVDYKCDSITQDAKVSSEFAVFNNIAEITVDPIAPAAIGDNVTITVNVGGQGLPLDGKVIITVNGTDYESNLTNGKAVFTVPGTLAVGSYNVKVVYVNDTVAKTAEVASSFEVYNKASIVANDLTRGYNSGNDFQATLTDKYGNPIADTEVEFTVNCVVYKVKTNANGVAVLSVPLGVGSYSITVKHPTENTTVTKSATIVKRIDSNKGVSVFYLTAGVYKVCVFGDDGKVAGAGQSVKFTINGKTYYRTTDKNGYATLKISLPPKTYTVTAEYKGYKVSNKFVVKHIIKAKKTV